MRIVLLLAGLLAVLPGCLERSETIRVNPDGSIDVEYRTVGDPADLAGGAARYPVGPDFHVTRSTRTKDDGEPEETVVAKAHYPSADDMPAYHGDPDDPLVQRGLEVTTELKHVDDELGPVLVFARTYKGRTRAPYRRFWDRAFSDEVQAWIDAADRIPSLPLAKKQKLIKEVLDYHRLQMQYWADRALAQVAPASARRLATQLVVRARIDEYAARRLTGKAVEGVMRRPVERIDAFCQEIEREVRRIALDTARVELKLDASALDRLELALRAEQHDHDVTHDLSDENFVVRVALPGDVIHHNADAVESGVLVWRFDGADLDDRDHVLLAAFRMP